METAVEQSTPVSEQGFAASEPVQVSDMQQAMRHEHASHGETQQPGQTNGLYAGKYQTVEALVDGYKNLQSSYVSYKCQYFRFLHSILLNVMTPFFSQKNSSSI